MRLTDSEKAMLDGLKGSAIAQALDYIVQLGEAFDAERLVDINYCHYPAEMGIYKGSVEELVKYTENNIKVCVPTTTSTLCCDLERPDSTGCPTELLQLQAQAEIAHRKLGIMETYTCTPQQLGFVPPFGSIIASVESSAIIYFNSVLGARTNRGGLLTRYSAITGKYPLMGYLLYSNRRGTHYFRVELAADQLNNYDAYMALGYHIGNIVGSEVPVIDGIKPTKPEYLIGLGAALATSGSVTLFHIPGVTPEAHTVEQALQKRLPQKSYLVTKADLDVVYEKLTDIEIGSPIDFVNLGCPHYSLDKLQELASKLDGKKISANVRFWVNTNRMTRKQAEYSGYIKTIEDAGVLVVADTCPVESHMRISTCREYGLKTPNIEAMVTNSSKMAHYVQSLIGAKTALVSMDRCIDSAIAGRLV